MFRHARTNLGEILSACETMDELGFENSIKQFNIKNPLSNNYKFYLLLETRSCIQGSDMEKMNGFVEKMMELGLVSDGFVTDEPTKVKVTTN